MSNNPHPTNDLKKDYGGTGGSGKLKFFDIQPPIEAICTDSEQLNKSFNELPIIPYSGSNTHSSHKLVQVLYNFKDMSTTYAGILNDLKTYALGGKLQIAKNEDTDFDIGDEQKVSNEQQRSFLSAIRENLHFGECSIPEFTSLIFDSRRSVGMVGVEIIKETILGKPTIKFNFRKPFEYVFLQAENLGFEIVVSKKWDYDYLKKNPPRPIPLFPFWQKYKDGTERTFYYRKDGAELYGRPKDLSCLPDKYNEYKLKQYLTKKNKKLWTPDVYIESEDANLNGAFTSDENAKAAGYENAQQRIERKFTNEGDGALTFIFTNRPSGARPTFIHEFAGLKNADQVKMYRDMFKEGILSANSWAKLMLDMEGATGFSNNAFFEVFAIKSVTTLLDVQVTCEKMINDLIRIGLNALGMESEYGIRYTSPLKEMQNEFNEQRRGNSVITKPEDTVSTTGANL